MQINANAKASRPYLRATVALLFNAYLTLSQLLQARVYGRQVSALQVWLHTYYLLAHLRAVRAHEDGGGHSLYAV